MNYDEILEEFNSKYFPWNVDDSIKIYAALREAVAELDAARAVIEQVREWHAAFRREYRYEPLAMILNEEWPPPIKVDPEAFMPVDTTYTGENNRIVKRSY